MQQKLVIRYSMSFKRQVVSELESGRFDSIGQASEHYGISGSETVRKWLRKFGRNHLCPKVIRVEKPNEQDQVRQLKKQIKQLKEALGQTQAGNVIFHHGSYSFIYFSLPFNTDYISCHNDFCLEHNIAL